MYLLSTKRLEDIIYVVCSERYNNELLTKRCIFQIFKCNLFEKLNNNMLSSIMNGKMI